MFFHAFCPQRSFLDDLLHRSSIDDAKPSSHTASSPPPPPAGSGPSSPFAPLDENVASAASVTPRGEASPDGGGAASTARRPTPGGGDAASPNGRVSLRCYSVSPSCHHLADSHAVHLCRCLGVVILCMPDGIRPRPYRHRDTRGGEGVFSRTAMSNHGHE